MYLRTLSTALCRFQRTYRANNHTRLQRCSFKAHLEIYSGNIHRNFRSQNLKLLTNSWIQRLKEGHVPEAELSVKFITEHVLGKERTQVYLIMYYILMEGGDLLLFGENSSGGRGGRGGTHIKVMVVSIRKFEMNTLK